jgi:hypothetical protein
MIDITRPGRPLLMVDGDQALVIHGEFVLAAEVATSPCHMGGVRRWLICPPCRVRRQTLYIADARLKCRRCASLRYPTQAMGRRSRAFERADRIRQRLGWEPGVLRPWGARPKRMRWSTYTRLTDTLRELEERLLPDLSDWAGKLEAHVNQRSNLLQPALPQLGSRDENGGGSIQINSVTCPDSTRSLQALRA